ncbi:MAG TPA: FAD-dependent thymidylate synthase [Caldilineae bacterium]|nr:FAD-dependent thymidylate synthase [Caldilineae bacterium]
MKVTLLAYTQPLITEPALAVDHNTATFLIEGVSRAATHQIVRHRLASISQESQRYVSLDKGGWGFVVPPDIARNPEAKAILDRAWEDLTRAYAELRALGIRKEDARFLLPNATETRMVISMNFAAWRHFCWLRCDKAAQWEVRAVAFEILRHLYGLVPAAFQDLYDTFLRNT